MIIFDFYAEHCFMPLEMLNMLTRQAEVQQRPLGGLSDDAFQQLLQKAYEKGVAILKTRVKAEVAKGDDDIYTQDNENNIIQDFSEQLSRCLFGYQSWEALQLAHAYGVRHPADWLNGVRLKDQVILLQIWRNSPAVAENMRLSDFTNMGRQPSVMPNSFFANMLQ